MTDVLCHMKEKALDEVNPKLFTWATLTGHVIVAHGDKYSVSYSCHIFISLIHAENVRKNPAYRTNEPIMQYMNISADYFHFYIS